MGTYFHHSSLDSNVLNKNHFYAKNYFLSQKEYFSCIHCQFFHFSINLVQLFLHFIANPEIIVTPLSAIVYPFSYKDPNIVYIDSHC